jgi:hypothetical protein
MRPVRLSIAGLMGIVLVTGIGLAALHSASVIWSGVLLLGTLGALGIALVGAFCGSGSARGGWIGFAVFGWIYLSTAFCANDRWPKLPTQSLLELLARWIGANSGKFPAFAGGFGARMGGMGGGGMGGIGGGGGSAGGDDIGWFFQIGHCLLALLAASLGALLGNRLFAAALDKSETSTAGAETAAISRPQNSWVVPLLVATSVLVLVAVITSAGTVFPPGIWAGSTFLLTWLVIGVSALGALVSRATNRVACLGATLFGAGFMVLAFYHVCERWPGPPTGDLLNEIRPWLPAFANGRLADPESVTAANARIHEALGKGVPMHFLEATPLENVLESIKKATTGADGKAIPIYVDPVGLMEAEKTMTSTVANIDLDGVPLRTSLRVCLAQLDLAYRVEGGLLRITSQTSEDNALLATSEDAFRLWDIAPSP